VKKILAMAIVLAAAATSQPAGQTDNPLSAGAKRTYGVIKGYITRAAAKMPEENYSFKPTPDVRSFGQLVGHIADANYGFCAAAAGEKPPEGGFEPGAVSIEKTKTSKADLEKALAESFVYCDKVHGAMTDSAGAAMVKFMTGDMPKLSILEFNTHHDFEHYGNIVTYMRLKGLVPPSSEQQRMDE
jgi:uncharacterized damage-inducible protein DinB